MQELITKNCPVCDSSVTGHVRDVLTRRTKKMIPLRGCFNCRSFANPSGYREDEAQLKADLQWGLGVASRNEKASASLLDHLAKCGVHPTSIIDIGCGIGTLIKVAKSRNISGIGFDLNHLATSWGRENNSVDLRTELWSPSTPLPRADLYTCIMVLEHLETPRVLLENLCIAATRDHAAIFVSVPFVEQKDWHYLEAADPHESGTWLFDNDVHVTHFSIDGLTQAFRHFGHSNLEFVKAGLWHGVLSRPQQSPQ